MANDEEDYMSAEFLSKCDDKRPGLVPRHVARQYENHARRKRLDLTNQTKPRKVLETEKREEGLKKIISSDNKGFAMLQRMGYKPGMALGKQADARKEPVPIQFKAGRSGLGHETEQQRKRQVASTARAFNLQKRQKLEETRKTHFRERNRKTFAEKKAERDLYKSQKVCEQLDSQKEIKEPPEEFFWPASYLNKTKTREDGEAVDEESDSEEDEEEEELLSAAEKLEILTMYLRNQHLYCVWCGTAFTDKDDMKENCPGNTAEAHDD